MLNKLLNAPFTRLTFGLMIIVAVTVVIQLGLQFIFKTLALERWLAVAVQSAVLCIALPLVYILFYQRYEHREITELNFKGFFRQIGLGLITGFLFISAVVCVIWIFADYTVMSISASWFLLTAFLFAMATGVMEEILFRGIVFRLVEEKLGTWTALILSALLFGLLHIWGPGATLTSSLAIALEAGVLLAAAYIYTRNLWFPIFLHAAWNFSLGSIYGLVVSGTKSSVSLFESKIAGPQVFTGGNYGPENSIQSIILGLALSAVLIVLAKRKDMFIRGSVRKFKDHSH